MSQDTPLERFVARNPLAVMARCIAATMLDERVNQIFVEQRTRQYEDKIQFSHVALSMAEIALGTVENRNQAYHKYQAELQATKESYYRKVNRTEPALSEGVVTYAAERASEMLTHLQCPPEVVLAGYRCVSLDGNHLQKTEKRLSVTRGLHAAPLTGTVVARFDHQTRLFDRAYLLEDAHAQESSVLDRVLDDVAPRDLVIADRHFCIVSFLVKLAARSGCFVIRQHGRLQGKLRGNRQYVGTTETGEVYEQLLEIGAGDDLLVVRRITVCLKTPTRDGDHEIHVLTNVPVADGDACALADLYRRRWEIETAFYLLTTTLNCESTSNCHPRCALLQFCMAMVAYNCRQVLLAALCAEHGEEDVQQMSQHRVALDIVRPLEGLHTAITDAEWLELVPPAPLAQAEFLRRVARAVNVKSYRKSQRGSKKPPTERAPCPAGTHVSVAKLLKQRKKK